jgi:hypothetical protein
MEGQNMASGVYNHFKTEIMKGTYDLVNDTVYAALLNSTHSFDADNNTWSTVSANEISGSGYTANGNALGSKAVTQDDTDDEGVFDAVNSVWTSASFTARHCVIWDLTATSKNICSIDFTGDQTVTSGTFTIQWNSEGIVNIN